MTDSSIPRGPTHAVRPLTTQQRFPRGVLIAAGILVLASIAFAAAGRYADVGTVRMPVSTPVIETALGFADNADGSITVTEAASGRLVATIPPESNGFIRGVMRGMARERMLHSVSADPPFLLTRWANGTLSLHDPTTGRKVELDAFGPTNAQAFAGLLNAAEALP